ncbi:hypothetical protein BS47DRAFT_1055862 [Hydnum rufescens UP504]|uniref:Uncharacterized protein n=1 Tax=Hydnum rufescens UP504 TaxID=1448309 RepID=A0A9P6AV22_9AGAM|nr:hypothetical protein BS47DRAFT_1055862 [Hydnum rufescens UP504]
MPEPDSKVTPATSERPLLDIPIDREPPVIDVAKASPSTVSDEQPRDIGTGSLEAEENLAPVASERPVLDSPINADAPVVDATETPVPSASKEQPSRGVALEGPEPEGDVAPAASERPVLDSPTLRDTLVADVVEAQAPSASDEQPRAVMPTPPEPEYDLTPTASERPILNTPINSEAPLIDAAKASPPGAPVEAATPKPPKPEEAPVINVAEVSLSTPSDELPRVLVSGPPEPEVNLAPVASDLPVLDSAINLDTPAIDAAEALVNGASKEQPSRGVAPEDPKPEGDVAPVASEGPVLVLDSPTLQDTLVADVVEAPAPSASDEQSRAVTSGPPESEYYLTPAASEIPIINSSINRQAPVIEVAKASPSSASVEQPRAVGSRPSEPEEAPIIGVAEVSPSSTSIEKAGPSHPDRLN